jgi:hypothetical protein
MVSMSKFQKFDKYIICIVIMSNYYYIMDGGLIYYLLQYLSGSDDETSQESTKVATPRLDLFKGLFDIHITVDDRDIYKVSNFCKFNNIRFVYNVSRTNKYVTVSVYRDKTDGQAALEYAHDIVQQMEDYGIFVRTFIIATTPNNIGIVEFMKTDEYKNNPCYYYEYKFRVDIKTEKEQIELDDMCENWGAKCLVDVKNDSHVVILRIRGEDCDKESNAFYELLSRFRATKLVSGNHFVIYDSSY